MAPEQLDDAKKNELGINDDVNEIWMADIDPKGTAAEACLKKGDAITKINGITTITSFQLSELIARAKPGDKLSVTYLRNGSENTVEVMLKSKLGTFASQQNEAIKSLGPILQQLVAMMQRKWVLQTAWR